MTQSPNGTIDAEKAKEAIAADNKKRADLCQKEIAEILEKHKCTIDVSTVVRTGQHPSHLISVIAK